MRAIALASALLIAAAAGTAIADESGDIVEQNGVLIFYPPGTGATPVASAAVERPVVVNTRVNIRNVVVSMAGWQPAGQGVGDPRIFQRYPCFCRMYSGPRYPF